MRANWAKVFLMFFSLLMNHLNNYRQQCRKHQVFEYKFIQLSGYLCLLSWLCLFKMKLYIYISFNYGINMCGISWFFLEFEGWNQKRCNTFTSSFLHTGSFWHHQNLAITTRNKIFRSLVVVTHTHTRTPTLYEFLCKEIHIQRYADPKQSIQHSKWPHR